MKNLFCLLMLTIILILTGCGSENPSGYADAHNLSLRDPGPAGGLIFYINPNASKDGWKYLEAAPGDQSTGIQWYNGTHIDTGARSKTQGSGYDNTPMIVKAQGAGSYAAQVCLHYIQGGEIDWYLPAEDELIAMHQNLNAHGVGGFASEIYWSSSESGTSMVEARDFNFGT